MAKKHKEPASDGAAAIRSLFSADNPFRRKPSDDEPAPPVPTVTAAVSAALGDPESQAEAGPSAKERKDGARRKRKRDEVEAGYERRRLGAPGEEPAPPPPVVGEKRKVPEDLAAAAGARAEEEEEAFDDESKLLRTVFVGNLPLRTKRKSITKEFAAFGEIESVRIRSVPLSDTKIPRKGAVIKGKINDSVDNVHAYIVFKDEQGARAALSHNMGLFDGNHIRVDMACPPRKKLKGEGALYDRKRTVFVGNLPFDIKDEEVYQKFCGSSGSEADVEAIRVIRDPESSLGKGIAYVLFKTREAANTVVRKRDLKIRDRLLRLGHAKSTDSTPKKTMDAGKTKGMSKHKIALTPSSKSHEGGDKTKRKASALSYQGLRASKSGVVKKAKVSQRPSNQGKQQGRTSETGHDSSSRIAKRPAVAARKAKQLAKKRKLDAQTPENTHRSKKAKK
ncbi:RNA-binding protein 34 [Oryza brachyantha]|uniref:RRM domain-containing protein n=1 Tax=Oryza brachyantha TaxID=4533 RepID=J3LUX1_ORYBR|nr:RNA-binding protein 34 [Oryza brachyantha]